MRARIRISNQIPVMNRWPNATFHRHDPQWHGGCADPGCCTQHPGLTPSGELMIGVEILGVSGREFHRGLMELANEGLAKVEHDNRTNNSWEPA